MEEVRRINSRGQIVCAVTFNGKEYRRYPNGKHPNYYYHKWKFEGKYHQQLLHHAVYKFYCGAIPEGKIIHHKDGNPLNNDISNLVAVTPSEHQKIHSKEPGRKLHNSIQAKKISFTKDNWHERRKVLETNLAKQTRVCEWCGASYTPTNVHQRFCSKYCHHKWQYVAPENNVTLTCQYCGKEFQGNKYLKPKTCSDKCAHSLLWAKRRKNI